MTRPLPDDATRLLERFGDEVQETILRLRDRVLTFVPDAFEVITDVGYTVSLQYGPDERVSRAFCYVAGFSGHANLGFQHGASLPDPENVMKGAGAHMRHIKFAQVEQTQAPWLDGYLQSALEERGLDGRIGDGRTEVRRRPADAGRTRRSNPVS